MPKIDPPYNLENCSSCDFIVELFSFSALLSTEENDNGKEPHKHSKISINYLSPINPIWLSKVMF